MQIFFCFLLFSFPVCPCAFFQRVLQSVLSCKANLHYHALVKIAIRVLDLRNEIDHPLPLRQVFSNFHFVDVYQFLTVHITEISLRHLAQAFHGVIGSCSCFGHSLIPFCFLGGVSASFAYRIGERPFRKVFSKNFLIFSKTPCETRSSRF